jgi:hypothetical protein
MRRICLMVGLLLTGCASNAAYVPRPAGGYAGLQVLERVVLPKGTLGGQMELDAGTRLIADRALPSGEPLYCGDVSMSDPVFGRYRSPRPVCFAWRGGMLTANPDRGGGDHTTNPVPPGSIEAFRLR